MGAVTADVVLVGDFLVQRVGACGLRQLEEEGGIEHEDLRNVRQKRTHDFSALGFRTVVQRREHGEVLDWLMVLSVTRAGFGKMEPPCTTR